MSDSTIQPDASDDFQRKTKIWLIVSQTIMGLLLVPWIVYSTPGSQDNGLLNEFQFFIRNRLPLVLLVVVNSVLAWRQYAQGNYKNARIITSLPLVVILLAASCALIFYAMVWIANY